MAALALGLLVAGPQAAGVAAADSTDDATSADVGNPGTSRGHATSRPATDSSRPARTTRTESGAAPAARRLAQQAPRPAASLPRRAGRVAQPAIGNEVDAPLRAVAGVSATAAATATEALPASSGPSGTASPPAAVAAPNPVAALAIRTPAAAAVAAPSATAGVSASAAPAAAITRVVNLIDGGLNWLNGLPASPVTELMSGALLLVRRNLEAGSAAPLALASSAQVGNTFVVSTFVVSTLSDSGAGSLRQAIIDANATPGPDQITFSVGGVIRVGRNALPTITGTTVIDGTTAPGYVAAPVVRVDYQKTAGLTLAAGSDGSVISGLSLVDATGAGVTIAASDTTLTGNYIGIWGNGRTVEGNRGEGVLIQSGAAGNRIGIGGVAVFTLSNVISGNRGNGITISGGNDNVVQANFIGTDPTGTKARANGGNGIQITADAADNLIGGTQTGGNNPTDNVFRRPPEGNLVSGNRGNGVLIDDGATGNQLSGNYIGTQASGNAALGNRRDGVAIVGADYNQITGTTSLQDPFVFYNVLSGNRGNGLRVTDSDHIVVHANFFGIGADNSTAVANRGDGMLVNGDSQLVDSGGEIPLGNVMSGNRRWGIEVADTVGGFTSFNNFVGQAAFLGAVPNRKGGILVTSSNPAFDPTDEYSWNRIRTSLIGGNRGNGIEFAGNAHGAEVTETAVGTNYTINGPLPNTGNGIVVGGNSNQIAIGGFQPSVEEVYSDFGVHVGSNRGYGIVFKGRAHDNLVFDTRVGLGTGESIEEAAQLPNGRGGIFLGWGTANITIGGPRDAFNPGLRYFDEIVGNKGNGVTAFFSKDLELLGSTISGNRGSGVVLTGAAGSTIGYPLAGNIITDNGRFGLYATGRLDGSSVQANTIKGNGASGVRLSSARGITIGGANPVEPNVISDNAGWGIFASGWSSDSALSTNFVNNNTRGNVNTTFAFGLTTTG